MKKIPIFKTGTHTATNGESLSASHDFIRSVVASYNPKNHEAPAVIGHPKDNHPAYGWVESLSFDEPKGVLYANFKQLEQNFVKMLQDGRFKKRSASFYPPDHPSNPTKGKPYLRQVGFLGAQAPAIKGLADFNDNTQCPVYEFSEIYSHLPQDKLMPEKQPDEVIKTIDFAEREAELQSREAAIAKREQVIEEQRQQGFNDFAEALIKAGKIVPAERESILSFLTDIDSSNRVFSFSENGQVGERSSVDSFKSLLHRLPPLIEFSELCQQDPNSAARPMHVELDANDLADQKIQSFAEKHNIGYAEALQKIDEDK